MDEGTRLVERLAAMGHPLAGELAAVLDCVEVIAPQGTADSRQLAGIYDGRAGHLAQFQSPHADALRRDTQALATALGDLQDVPCEVWTFKRNEQFSFAVWVRADTRAPLGCVHVADRRAFDDESWAELWGQ